MKQTFLLLAILSVIICNAQTAKTTGPTKSVTINTPKMQQMEADYNKTHPKVDKSITPKVQKNTVTIKNGSIVKKDSLAANTTTGEVKLNPSAKPFAFSGTYVLNYDDKTDLKKSTQGKIKYALDGFNAAINPEFETTKDIAVMRSVWDVKENEMTMLTEDKKGKKNGLLLKIPKAKLDTKTTKPPVIKKTGVLKVIQGFKCEKVLISYGDTTKIESWVTPDLSLSMTDAVMMCNSSFKGKSPFSSTNISDVKGTALETTITYKDGGTMKLTITDIKKAKPAPVLFSMDGYTVKDARGLPMFGGQ